MLLSFIVLFTNSSFAIDIIPNPFDDKITDIEKELEKTSLEDKNNLNYYPKLNFLSPLLFTGANTLQMNEVFFSIRSISSLSKNTSTSIFITPFLSIGYGLFDNVFLYTSIPYKFYLNEGINGLSDSYIGAKIKFLEGDNNFSFQIDNKIPLGNKLSKPNLGDGQIDIQGSLLYTRNFDIFYIQSLLGYNYRFPYTANNQTTKLSDELVYLIDIGSKIKNFENFTINISFDGFLPILFNNLSTYKYLSISPNITYNFLNFDASLGIYKILFSKNYLDTWGINFGITIKNKVEYPSIFKLLLLEKIDSDKLISIKGDNDERLKIFINNCNRCHAIINPNQLGIEDWNKKIEKYRQKKIITKSEEIKIKEFLEDYLNKK
jgi:hypothetical protein